MFFSFEFIIIGPKWETLPSMSANLTMLKDSTFCASKKINPLPLCKFSKTTKWSLLKKVDFIDILVYTQCISNTTFLKKTKKNVKKEMLIVTFRNISILKDQGFFFSTYCVRHSHALPFLRKKTYFSLLKSPKSHV